MVEVARVAPDGPTGSFFSGDGRVLWSGPCRPRTPRRTAGPAPLAAPRLRREAAVIVRGLWGLGEPPFVSAERQVTRRLPLRSKCAHLGDTRTEFDIRAGARSSRTRRRQHSHLAHAARHRRVASGGSHVSLQAGRPVAPEDLYSRLSVHGDRRTSEAGPSSVRARMVDRRADWLGLGSTTS